MKLKPKKLKLLIHVACPLDIKQPRNPNSVCPQPEVPSLHREEAGLDPVAGREEAASWGTAGVLPLPHPGRPLGHGHEGQGHWSLRRWWWLVIGR